MDRVAKVKLADRIDAAPLSSFQWGVIILCGLSLIMDGFDVQSMGYVAPAIIQDWKIPSSVLGPVFSAALVGVLIGSLLFSMLADRIGRRPVLIVATLYFSALTFMTPLARTVAQLLTIRLIAGIGLGGIMPQAMALAGEYSPKRLRAGVMTMISGGFTVGAAFGGFVAAYLIPAFGWPAVFYFGGSIPLVLAVVMFFALPESLQLLALRGNQAARITGWLRRIDPNIDPQAEYVTEEQSRRGVPAIHLFREGRALITILLWVVLFMNLLDLYFLSSWVPTVVKSLGYSTSVSVLVGTAVQVGGTLGTIAISWWISARGFMKPLFIYLAIGCITVGLIGQPGLSLALLFVVVFMAGWGIVGSQPAVTSLAGQYYPTDLRSTGIGWGLGIGRIGAIIGPIIGGEMIAYKWSTHSIFLAAAIPALISTLVIASLARVMKSDEAVRSVGVNERHAVLREA